MAKRFGRNQRRKLKASLAAAENLAHERWVILELYRFRAERYLELTKAIRRYLGEFHMLIPMDDKPVLRGKPLRLPVIKDSTPLLPYVHDELVVDAIDVHYAILRYLKVEVVKRPDIDALITHVTMRHLEGDTEGIAIGSRVPMHDLLDQRYSYEELAQVIATQVLQYLRGNHPPRA